jgi:membrane protein required for colicin V production
MTLPLNLNYFDLALLFVLLLFALRGLFRGFIDEISGLIGLISGFLLAGRFYPKLGQWLLSYIREPEFANPLAYVIILCSGIIIAVLVSVILKKIFKPAKLGWGSQLLGFCLGAAKGGVVCAFLVSLFLAYIGTAPFIQSSRLTPYIADMSKIWALLFPFQA